MLELLALYAAYRVFKAAWVSEWRAQEQADALYVEHCRRRDAAGDPRPPGYTPPY